MTEKLKAEIPHYHGHRERLRQRFRQAGADALPDYELMELLLFRSIPLRDTKPLAKAILARFGSFCDAINAPPDELAEVRGVGPKVIADLQVIRLVAENIRNAPARRRPQINSWSKALDYCRMAIGDAAKEQFRVLMLDVRQKLIADEILPHTTLDGASIAQRRILHRALACSAMSIVLARWHPSGEAEITSADLEIANATIAMGDGVGIHLADYLIINPEGHTSLRSSGVI